MPEFAPPSSALEALAPEQHEHLLELSHEMGERAGTISLGLFFQPNFTTSPIGSQFRETYTVGLYPTTDIAERLAFQESHLRRRSLMTARTTLRGSTARIDGAILPSEMNPSHLVYSWVEHTGPRQNNRVILQATFSKEDGVYDVSELGELRKRFAERFGQIAQTIYELQENNGDPAVVFDNHNIPTMPNAGLVTFDITRARQRSPTQLSAWMEAQGAAERAFLARYKSGNLERIQEAGDSRTYLCVFGQDEAQQPDAFRRLENTVLGPFASELYSWYVGGGGAVPAEDFPIRIATYPAFIKRAAADNTLYSDHLYQAHQRLDELPRGIQPPILHIRSIPDLYRPITSG